MSETVQVALIAGIPAILTALGALILQLWRFRQEQKAQAATLAAQNEVLAEVAKQESVAVVAEKLDAVATSEAVQEVHVLVNSKADKLAAQNDAAFEAQRQVISALSDEVRRLNANGDTPHPDSGAPVTLNPATDEVLVEKKETP